MNVTKSNFNRLLNSVFDAYGKLSDKIQALIEFALNHYVETGNTVYIATMLNSDTEGQRLRAADIKLIIAFMREFSNLSIKVDNNFKYVVSKKSKKESPIFNKPDDSITWYNFSKIPNALSTFDIVQIAAALDSKYAKAKENENKKVVNQTQSEKFLKKLNALVSEFQPATS